MSLSSPRRPSASREAFEPISLGSTCTTKFQLSRRMYFNKYGAKADLHQCRRTLLTPDRGSANYERQLFDWWITPFSAVVHIVNEGFDDIFARQHFTVAAGSAVNTRLGTIHPHDFHAADPVAGLTEADIDREHAEVRGKFEHLAHRFVALNQRPGRHLYVFEGLPYFGHVGQFLAWLGSGSPDHDYRVLLVGHDEEPDQPYHALNGRLSWTRIPREIRKTPDVDWEGDDAHWDVALAPYRLWPHREQMIRCIDEPDAAPATPGLLKRLGNALGG